MKSIIYNYINRFWNSKSFLLRANAAKDMREMFEKDLLKSGDKIILIGYGGGVNLGSILLEI